MARVSKIETCMFCGAVPCECDKPADKPKRKRATGPILANLIPEPESIVPENVPEEKPDDPWPTATQRKPGPFASMGFVHASKSLHEHAAEVKAEEEGMTSEQAWSNIEDILGPLLDKDSQALVHRKAGRFKTADQTTRLATLKGAINEVG